VPGQTFTLDEDRTPGNADRVHLPHPEILSSLEPGHTVLIDDGKLRLRVDHPLIGAGIVRLRAGAGLGTIAGQHGLVVRTLVHLDIEHVGVKIDNRTAVARHGHSLLTNPFT